MANKLVACIPSTNVFSVSQDGVLVTSFPCVDFKSWLRLQNQLAQSPHPNESESRIPPHSTPKPFCHTSCLLIAWIILGGQEWRGLHLPPQDTNRAVLYTWPLAGRS